MSWREIEKALIRYFELRGDRLRHDLSAGRTYLATEIYDEDTGQLREVRKLFDFETLARALADEIRVGE
jgi:hypothetical protein